MYKVLIDGDFLYYPEDSEYIAYNLKLVQELGDAGYFEFDVPIKNPQYDNISVRQSLITVYKDEKAIFYGEVREIEEGLYFQKHVYCVGELAYLYDSIQPQRRYQCSPLEMFTAVLTEHNNQVEAGKQFTVGMVTVTDANDYIYRYSNYEETLKVLKEDLCESLDGYLRVRHANGKRYLDLVTNTDYGKLSSQEVRFGENILEYAGNVTSETIATAVVPLGAKLEESVVEGLDAYTTIESVNSGVNYVYNQAAVNRFGWVKVVKKWTDVTEPSNLKKKAEEWLTSTQFAELSFELTAIDLSQLDSSIDSYEVGDRVSVICDIYGINTVVPVYKKETTLDNVEQNRITLGDKIQQSLSTQNSNRATQIEKQLPQESSILQAAKENATNMLTGANGGYVLFGINDDGQIEELFITDNLDKTKAQKVWRWNINGLGYSSTGLNGKYGTAITSDGSIVADFITTGYLYATRIKGGTLTLGGDDNQNGILEIKNASGKTIGSWDNAGIVVNDGEIVADVLKSGILKDRKTGNIFFLDLDNGVLKANFDSLSISGYSAATQKYADEGDESTLSAANKNAQGYASNAVNNLSQKDIFNKLTNNGAVQGIYLENNKVYINASYIGTGTLSADRIEGGTLTLGGKDNVSGKLVIKDANGKTIGQWNNGGFSVNKGAISGTSFKGGSININDKFVVDGQGNVKIYTKGGDSDYLRVDDGNGHYITIGGEYVYAYGASKSVKWVDILEKCS